MMWPAVELLEVVDAGFLQDAVEGAGVEIDLAVVVPGADDGIEIDPAVEEVPGDVAHAGAQEGIRRHLVGTLGALGRPAHGNEIRVARQLELAEPEAAVAGDVAGFAGDDGSKDG